MMGLEQRRDDALLLEAEAAVQLVALPPTLPPPPFPVLTGQVSSLLVLSGHAASLTPY